MAQKQIELTDIIERIRNRAIDMSYAQGLLEEAQRALDAGKTSAALECLEGADCYMSSTLDMLPIAHNATLRRRRQLEHRLGLSRKPANLWRAECMAAEVNKPDA